MANDQRKEIYNGEDVTNATVVSAPVGFEGKDDDFIFELRATKTDGTGDLDGKIQHSFDKVNWYDLGAAFATLSDSGVQLMIPAANARVLQYIRSSITVASGATYNAVVTALYRKRD